jgi:cation diffusion facilitator family transporter
MAQGSDAACSHACLTCSEKSARAVIYANLVLGIFKLVVGALAFSSALSADGIQSLACAVIAFLVAKSMKLGKRPPDSDFPFGYGKAEFVTSVISLTFLLGLGLFMLLSSTALLLAGRTDPPEWIALPVAVVSIVGNYLMYKFCHCAAVRADSPAMMANAKQNRADMQSSCAVLIGVSLTQIHPSLAFFDALATMVVAVMIMVDAAGLWWADMRVLVDDVVAPEMVHEIEDFAGGIAGVKQAKLVRARHDAGGVTLDLTIRTSAEQTVSGAVKLCQEVGRRIGSEFDGIASVNVFPHPEEPQRVPP